MNAVLKPLESCPSPASLKAALQAICLRFGTVTRIDVLPSTQIDKPQALCFLRMETTAQEQALMHELNVGRFGGDVVIVINLKNRWPTGGSPFSPANVREAAPRWA